MIHDIINHARAPVPVDRITGKAFMTELTCDAGRLAELFIGACRGLYTPSGANRAISIADSFGDGKRVLHAVQLVGVLYAGLNPFETRAAYLALTAGARKRIAVRFGRMVDEYEPPVYSPPPML